nr:immunoglobulin heavy chain junction region [Mus musculus]
CAREGGITTVVADYW